MLIQKKSYCRVRDEGLGYDALLSRYGGVAECGSNLAWTGKYVVEILKRFDMTDYKTMATPMASNWKLLNDASSESVDDTMYQ